MNNLGKIFMECVSKWWRAPLRRLCQRFFEVPRFFGIATAAAQDAVDAADTQRKADNESQRQLRPKRRAP